MFYVTDDFKITTLLENDTIEYTANSHSTAKSINKEFDASPTVSAGYSDPSYQQVHLENVNNNFTSAFQPKINLQQKLYLQNESSMQVTENDSIKIVDPTFISQSSLKCIQTMPTVNNQSNCLTDVSKQLETKLVDGPSTIANDNVQSYIKQLKTYTAADILLNISSNPSNQQGNQMAKIDSTKTVKIANSKPPSETIQITPTDDTQLTYSSAAKYGYNQTQIASLGSTSVITNNRPVVLNSFTSNSNNHLNSNGLIYQTVKILHDTYGFVVLPNNIWQSIHYKDFNITMFFEDNTLCNTFCKKVSFNNSLVPYIHINNKCYEYSKAIISKHELEYLLKDINRNNVCLGIDGIIYNKCIGYTNSKLCCNCNRIIN